MAETSPAPSDSKASANDNVIGSGNTQPPTVLAGNSDNGGSGDGEAGGDGPGNVQNQGKFIILWFTNPFYTSDSFLQNCVYNYIC